MYRLRFLIAMARALLSPQRGLLDDFILHFRVLPLIDTDVQRLFTHVFSLYMAICRWHFVFNSPLRGVALRNRWVPITTAEMMVYKKSILAFDRVEVRSKLVCWDEKRFYMEQTFSVREVVHAVCYVEGLLRGPSGVLEPPVVFRELGVDQPSPAVPATIEKLFKYRG